MAEIHLARSKGIEGFEKLVVVKKLLERSEQDPSLVSMFLDEARVAATLHHPNVVQVYDIGVENDAYFFSMEFVYGQDLSHLLRRAAAARKPLSLDTALTIIIGLCSGLHYAHEKEGADGKPLHLVHRDVSPQNVLISYDGAVKLMDFGIAKAASNSQVTRDGTLKGKIAYMSPEQGTSGNLDRRSDVFSLATILWELTTFRRLFRADSDFESLRKIIQQDAPRPSRFRPDYPPALERIVMKGLQRDKTARYQSAQEMQLDLEEFARDQRLVISSVSLSRYIRELFHERVEAWAKAQSEGRTFTEFLISSPLAGEGTSVTADTWIAPATEPTSTTSVGPEISIEIDPSPVYPALRVGRRGWMFAVAGIAVVALAIVGWKLLADPGTATTPPAASVTPPAPKQTSAVPQVTPTVAPTVAPGTPANPTPVDPVTPATAGSASPSTSQPPVKRPVPVPKPIVKKKPKPANVDLDSPFPD